MNFFAGSMAYLVQAVIQNTRDLKIYIIRQCYILQVDTAACGATSNLIPLSDRGRSPDRTLQNLKSDNHKFLQAGGNIKNANILTM